MPVPWVRADLDARTGRTPPTILIANFIEQRLTDKDGKLGLRNLIAHVKHLIKIRLIIKKAIFVRSPRERGVASPVRS